MKQRLVKVLGFILISLFILSLSIAITINFTPLYSFDINYLNISENINMSKEQILVNYRILIAYLNYPWISELTMPDFSSSESGLFHFYEVKRLFLINYSILLISGMGSLGFLLYSRGKKLQKSFLLFFKSGILVLLSIIVAVLISFDAIFLLFHQTFFNNDAWLFNPATDPIIEALPAEFFLHNFLLVFGLSFSFLTIGLIVTKYKKIKAVPLVNNFSTRNTKIEK